MYFCFNLHVKGKFFFFSIFMWRIVFIFSSSFCYCNYVFTFRQSNQNLNSVLQKWGMPYDYKALESFYIKKLQILLSEKSVKKRTIGKNSCHNNKLRRVDSEEVHIIVSSKNIIGHSDLRG